jgi:amino acid permease
VRYIQSKFAPGSINSSVFSAIQVTLGAGILTFPYAIMENGVIWGTILVFIGAFVSWYIASLLILASDHCGKVRYEDIALVMYGRKFAIFTSILILVSLLGINMSYIVYMQTAIPDIIGLFTDKKNLPEFIGDTDWGHRFWGTALSFIVLLPMSIPRQTNSLRYFSAMGVICSLYLALGLFFLFWCDRTLVPSPIENFKNG